MAKTFRLKIVTPEKVVYDDEAEMVVFKTTEGDIGVMQGHIPTTTLLASGVTVVTLNNESKRIAVHAGFAEILQDKTTLVCESAEWEHEIDEERAKEAKKRAEERLRQADIDVIRAKMALARANARLEAIIEK